MSDMSARVGRRAVLGGLAGTALLAAGCSEGGTSGKGAAASSGGKPRRGGRLRYAASDFNEMSVADPQSTSCANGVTRGCFDALIRADHKGKPQLDLAESFEPQPKDTSVWTIRVRDGIEFHHGKTLSADDVIYSIKRILDSKSPGAGAGLLSDIDVGKLKKLDKRTVRLHLKRPNSQLTVGFNSGYASILPTDFDPKKPIGTGPFKQGKFTPHQRWIGKRNGNFWRDEGPYLDTLELLGFANPTATLNAMLGGQIDAMDHLLASQIPQVKSRSDLVVVESKTGGIQQLSMNSRKGQDFEDPRVRLAFKLMLDRAKLVDAVYGGHGAVGNDVGVFPEWSAGVDPKLDPEQDLPKAESLLKAAGKEGMKTTLRVGELVPGMKAAAELIVQQAKKIGVTISLENVTDAAAFYSNDYYKAQMQIDYTSNITMYDGCMYYWLKDAGYNAAGYSNPKVGKLFNQALKSDQGEAETKFRQMSDIIAEDGPWLVWGRQNSLGLHSSEVRGITKDENGQGLNGGMFWDVSIA